MRGGANPGVRVLAVILSAVVVFSLLPGAGVGTETVQAADNSEWTQFSSDTSNSGTTGGTGPGQRPGVKWSTTTNDDVRSSPAVGDQLVFVGSDDNSLYAFDRSTGDTEWSVNLSVPVRSSPALLDGTVYVAVGSGVVYAFDAQTGSVEWSEEVDPINETSSLTVADQTVYVGDASGVVRALNATDGSPEWLTTVGSAVDTTLAVADRTVYAANGTAMKALNATDGSQEWQFDADGLVTSSPAVVNGSVFFGTSNGVLHAVDATSGASDWSTTTDARSTTSPAVANGTVFAGNDDGDLVALNEEDGTTEWTYSQSLTQFKSAPAVVNGTLYIGGTDGNLRAFDTEDGSQEWIFTTNGAIYSSPAVAGGELYVGSSDNATYALDEKSGNVSGSLTVDEPITERQDIVAVETTFENPSFGEVHLNVTNLDNGLSLGKPVSASGTTKVFQAPDLGGLDPGDVVSVELYESSLEQSRLANTTTTVKAVNGTAVGGCTDITSSGLYTLGNDIVNGASSTCVNISADDVVLEGLGQFITPANSVTPSAGVKVDGVDNVTLRNVSAAEWTGGVGLSVNNSSNVTVRGGLAINNSLGIVLDDVTDFTVSKSTAFTNSQHGVETFDASNGTLKNILAINNSQSNGYAGLSLGGNTGESSDITLKNITADGNLGDGLDVEQGLTNITVQNIIASGNEGAGVSLASPANVTTATLSENNISLTSTTTVSASDINIQSPVGNTPKPLSFEAKNIQISPVTDPQQNTEATSIGRYLAVEQATGGAVTNNVQNSLSGIDYLQAGAAGSYFDVTVTYLSTDVTGISESSLTFWRYTGTDWAEVSAAVVDETANTVSHNFTSLGTIGIFGGSPGELALTPATVQFPETATDESATESIQLSNTGNSSLTLEEIQVAGPDQEAFGTDTNNVTLAPGETTQVTVQFEPPTNGTFEAKLVFEDETGETRGTAPLTGNTSSSALTVSPAAIQFPGTDSGSVVTETVQLSNPGKESLSLQNISVEGPNATAFETETESLSIAPGESTSVAVEFEPPTTGPFGATLVLENGQVQTAVPLEGNGTRAELSLTPTAVQFPETETESTTTESVQIANTGNGTLTIETVAIEGPNATAFSTTAGALTLGPGESDSLPVDFEPQTSGSFDAALVFVDADGQARGTVELGGNGSVSVVGSENPASGDSGDDQQGEEGDGQDGEADGDGEDNEDQEDEEDQEDDEDDEDQEDDDEPTVETESESTETGAEVESTVENAGPDETVSVDVPEPEQEQDFEVDEISVTTTEETDFSLDIESSSEPLDSTPEDGEFQFDGTEEVGFVSVDASVDNEQIEEAEFRFTVSEERVDELGSDPEDVSMYQFDEETQEWIERPTEIAERSDGEVVLLTEGDGFSDWTAAAKRPSLNITDTEIDVEVATTDEDVTVQVFVTNTGGADGTYEAQLLANDEIVDREDATVPSNRTIIIDFVRSFDQPDLYEVQVNNVLVGTINITEDESVEVNTSQGVDDTSDQTGDSTSPGEDGGDGSTGEDGTDQSQESGDDEGSSDGGILDGFGPGFGVPGAVLAVLVGVFLTRWRERDGPR